MAQSKNCPFVVNSKIELKNIETMPHKNGIWQGMFQLRSAPLLSDVAVTSFNLFHPFDNNVYRIHPFFIISLSAQS